MKPKTNLSRRDLLGRAALGGAALGSLSGCGPGKAEADVAAVQTGKRVRWRLASSFPSSLDTIYGAAEVLSERLEALTGGMFQVRVYQAGELVPPLQVLDAVQNGSVEVGQTAGYYYTGKNPAFAFDTCVPFGLNARQQNAWLHEGGGLELMRGIYGEVDIVNFPCGNTGSQMGGWFRREIGGVADMKGLKMRIPGLGGKVMDALGVAVQVLGAGEIYLALERGAIDATEWVGPYDDEKLGLHKVAKNYYYPGWWEPGPSLSFLVGRSAWDALPATYQEAFKAASQEAASTMQARYDAKNPPALKRLVDGGVELRPFADEIMRQAQEASEQILSDEAAADPAYAAILENWRAFRADSFRWFGLAELSYANFAFGGR